MLPKIHRLKSQNDFRKLARTGRYFFLKELTFKWLNNNLSYSRFGIVVSVKVDKRAVWRNKIKRRINEIIHRQLKSIKPGFDILVITKAPIKELDFQHLKEIILGLLERIKLI